MGHAAPFGSEGVRCPPPLERAGCGRWGQVTPLTRHKKTRHRGGFGWAAGRYITTDVPLPFSKASAIRSRGPSLPSIQSSN